VRSIVDLRPDVVAVSGDLTQRARSHEFRQARRFLDALPFPQVVVPGNHDVPLYNLFGRFLQPMERFRRYISPDIEPFYADDQIAVMGLNTARSFTIKNGRINTRQLERIRDRLCPLDPHLVKIVVSHHPFDLPPRFLDRTLVGRAREAMHTLAHCGADLFLAGHMHLAHVGDTTARYQIAGFSALVVQAGTTTSTRGRGQRNSFNIIRIRRPRIVVEHMEWEPRLGQFAATSAERFQHTAAGWSRLSDPGVDVE
jgi:3',5'-cyclic AMP phosphodiesterase CpdA